MNKSSSLLVSFILLSCSPVMADISYAHRTEVKGAGVMSSFASESETLTQISGMNSRVDTEMQMKSKLVSLFGGVGNTSSVVCVDDGLTMRLLPEKKQYSVITFEQTRQDLVRAREAVDNATGNNEQQGTELPVSLDITVPVDKEVPVVLTVPVDIPLNETELHEPFVGLKEVIEPYKVMLDDLPDEWRETPLCKGLFGEICVFVFDIQQP